MVENLLSITRVGGENASIQKSPEAVEEVVADAVGKFRRLFPDINVRIELPEDVLFVPMDAVLEGVTIENAKYELTNGTVTRVGMISTSNEAKPNSRFAVTIERGTALIIFSRDRVCENSTPDPPISAGFSIVSILQFVKSGLAKINSQAYNKST